MLGNYTQITAEADQIFMNISMLEEDFKNTNASYLTLHNMTIEGLMDALVSPDNINVTFELSYDSSIDRNTRYIRRRIDF